jgi:hypothetical protein
VLAVRTRIFAVSLLLDVDPNLVIVTDQGRGKLVSRRHEVGGKFGCWFSDSFVVGRYTAITTRSFVLSHAAPEYSATCADFAAMHHERRYQIVNDVGLRKVRLCMRFLTSSPAIRKSRAPQ